MTIVLTGGGSGGHITPLLAVAAELKQLQPSAQLVYVGQTGDKLSAIPAAHPAIDAAYSVRAGKFRRYHGLGLRMLLKFGTLLLNIRDMFYVGTGFMQSLVLLRRLKPDVIFIKGGFVGVPVGLAAAVLKIPFVTHDSDAIPGLANRIIARWAKLHAVGQPNVQYPYPKSKTVLVGIPVQPEYQLVDVSMQYKYRAEINIAADAPVLTVAGGGLGAANINQAVLRIAPQLLEKFPGLVIIHQVGQIHEAAMNAAYDKVLNEQHRGQIFIKGYVTDMYRLSGAADVVVTRAGATNMAELATQGKACIIVPNPYLTGGHQLKNAEALVANQAVASVQDSIIEKDPMALYGAISQLLADAVARDHLATNLHRLAYPDAAQRLAVLLLEQTKSLDKHEETIQKTNTA